MPKWFKVVGFILLAFCLYAVLSDPDQAAELVARIFEALSDGVKAIGRFFGGILNRV